MVQPFPNLDDCFGDVDGMIADSRQLPRRVHGTQPRGDLLRLVSSCLIQLLLYDGALPIDPFLAGDYHPSPGDSNCSLAGRLKDWSGLVDLPYGGDFALLTHGCWPIARLSRNCARL